MSMSYNIWYFQLRYYCNTSQIIISSTNQVCSWFYMLTNRQALNVRVILYLYSDLEGNIWSPYFCSESLWTCSVYRITWNQVHASLEPCVWNILLKNKFQYFLLTLRFHALSNSYWHHWYMAQYISMQIIPS